MDQRRSRDGRHLTVLFGQGAGGWSVGTSYANSGLEFFDPGASPLGFYDGPDADGLAAALRQVRG